MNELEKLNVSIKESRYMHLVLFFILCLYFYFFGGIDLNMMLGIGFIVALLMSSNNYVSDENSHRIAIFHIVLILIMIDVYDFFSKEGNRLNNILNAITPVVFLSALYGFYLKRK
ncbi:hypothetical protein [Comamonas sp. B-9]|uniref:hypothetical protein n=1 Tax=Comamonas sp. B-9 TaxID=1055192 RepID=UPI0011DE1A2A|nr:hypothetical protein [Comamonas sp. B-9]